MSRRTAWNCEHKDRRNCGRGLCSTCYSWHRDKGTLGNYAVLRQRHPVANITPYKPYYTVREVSRFMGLTPQRVLQILRKSKATVRQWTKRGKILIPVGEVYLIARERSDNESVAQSLNAGHVHDMFGKDDYS